MSFASDVREELARLDPPDDPCALAEFSGMIAAGGVLSLSGGGGRTLALESERESVAARIAALAARVSGAQAELRALRREVPVAQTVYQALLRDGDADAALRITGVSPLSPEDSPPAGILERARCRRAYLRGAFLVSGTLGAPEKGYHLEWRLARLSCAEALRGILARDGIHAGIARRRDRCVLYLKDADRIADALAAMGAVSAVLALQNVRVVKSLRNSTNRRANCDNANIVKTMEASARQAEAIEYLEARGVLPTLREPLRRTAELRLEHREASLEELGEMFIPPVGKSAVNHRLRRLQAIADTHREGQAGTTGTGMEAT